MAIYSTDILNIGVPSYKGSWLHSRLCSSKKAINTLPKLIKRGRIATDTNVLITD